MVAYPATCRASRCSLGLIARRGVSVRNGYWDTNAGNPPGSAPAFTTAPHFDLYGYNDRNELTDSTRYNGPEPANPAPADHDPTGDFGYAYDAIGNRETYTAGMGPQTGYTSNNVNQYTATTDPAETFLYDADGNLAIDGSYVYTWDAENRLREVLPRTLTAGAKKLSLAYDYRGRRARKQAFEWTGSAYTLITERRFIYDGWNLLMELDGLAPGGTGVPPVIRTYTWGLDLSGQSGNATVSGLHGAGGIGGLVATHDQTASADYLYFHDANGNVGQLGRKRGQATLSTGSSARAGPSVNRVGLLCCRAGT